MTDLEKACERRVKMIMVHVNAYRHVKFIRASLEMEVRKLVESGLKFAGEGPLAEVRKLEPPVVDETWTLADVRKLARLLVKRAKLLDKIKGVLTLEAIADLECAIALDALRGKTR